MQREAKVGALVLTALAVLAVGIFWIGERRNLFSRTNRYFVRFSTVGGLAEGSPVQLSGVRVGTVDEIVLPRDIEAQLLTVWVEINGRYAERIRADSLVRIKTLGLLGDKYVEITSGSPESPQIPDRGEIPTSAPTDVDRLISSGEDVVDNLVAISFSLRTILGRMERGEGLLGQLTKDTPETSQFRDSLIATLESAQGIVARVERGEGTLGQLVADDAFADRLTGAVARLEGVLERFESGEGALPAMLNDPGTRESFQATLDNLNRLSEELGGLAAELHEGEGLLARLLTDQAYGDEVATELKRLVENLSGVSEKLNRGEGTVSQLINDPQIYEALNDIIVGINESRLLRWLIRNRQKAGIEKRFEAEVEKLEGSTSEPPGGDG